MKHMLTLAALLLAMTAGAAQADTVWKWTGKDGKPTYGKQPPPGVKAEQVQVKAANVGKLGGPLPATAAPGARQEQAAAIATMQPAEINGVEVRNGSVRSAERAAGRKGPPQEAKCPKHAPICRQKGEVAPAGPRPLPPGVGHSVPPRAAANRPKQAGQPAR